MKTLSIKPIKNELIDNFIDDNKLFALFDTPVNLIFVDNFIENIKMMKYVFMQNGLQENIFFSCKCNKSLALLHFASKESLGIEVSSKYELKKALNFTNKIIASGPKDRDYIEESIKAGCIISVDDIEELKLIKLLNKRTKILLRCSSNWVNIKSRFGIQENEIEQCLRIAKNSNIELIGFSFHINNYNLEDRVKMVNKILDMIELYKLNVKYIDMGGGIPINYCSSKYYDLFIKNKNKETFFSGKNFDSFYPYHSEVSGFQFLDKLIKNIKGKLGGINLIIEPGRILLNNCGISVYEVQYVKTIADEHLIITNSNINNLSEQWFNSDYLIDPLLYKKKKIKPKKFVASVAGNLCLENDIITWRKIEFNAIPKRGDYIIYFNTAGYQMDSNESEFHRIPLVKKYAVIKQKDKYIIKEDVDYDR